MRLSRDRRPKIQNAGVTKCDIIAKNGIVHEINDVISTKQQRRTALPSGSASENDSDEIDESPVLRELSFSPNFLRHGF